MRNLVNEIVGKAKEKISLKICFGIYTTLTT
jgi:hypothetical protein